MNPGVIRADAEEVASPEGSFRRRIFLMTDSFNTGGSERQFAALAGSLDKQRFETTIGCITRAGNFAENLHDIIEFPLGGNLYGGHSLLTRWRLSRFLRARQTDVAHAFDFYTNVLLAPVARLAKIPVVIGSQRQLGDLLSPLKSRAQLAAFRMCDKIVCNSQAAASRLISSGIDERRVCVIHNGLPRSAFLRPQSSAPSSTGIFRVGMVARMNTMFKNHEVFLRACARLARRIPKAEFVLVGDGPLRLRFERQAAELGIAGQVHFLGERSDIPEILSSLDVSVLPSASESLSNAIIESMAAGIPVVASNVGGNLELLAQERGILIPPQDDEALALAIDRLFRNPSLRLHIGENARRFAGKYFTIDEMRVRHEELYADLLERSRRRRKPAAIPVTGIRNARPQKQALRIIVVAPTLRYVGGQSVQADLLIKNWRDDPDAIAELLPVDPSFPRALQAAERVPVLRTIIREPIYALRLWRQLRNADVVHIFSASYSSFLIAALPASMIARFLRKRVLVHYHSGEARDHLRRSRVARKALSKVDRVVVPSEFLVKVFAEFGLAATAVPNTVDLSQFSFRSRVPLRPHLVCTRGFHPYYRVDLVVQAFAAVQKLFPEARLDLVGSGPSEREIRRLVTRLDLKSVNFVGVASRQDIAGFYEAADVFINASSLDNMPVSVLEAFASGTPVVSTSPEGMDYVVQHEQTGLLSAVGDSQALAQNTIRLLNDPALARMLAENAFQQSQRYRWSELRPQWIQIYNALASPPGRSRET